MNTTAKTTPGDELHTRAEKYAETHNCSYREGVIATLAEDKELAKAYAAPAARVSRMATTPAVPVTAAEEREIFDWIMRALRDGMAGLLSDALGNLAREADAFKKTGMPIEEAARRAMGLHPSLVAGTKLQLEDLRRNRPENRPIADGETAGDAVHNRAQALIAEHPHLDYHEAMGAVLQDNPDLKTAYARS